MRTQYKSALALSLESINGVPPFLVYPNIVGYVGNSSPLALGEKGASDNSSGTHLDPWATWSGARTNIPNTPSIIFFRPGHTETLTESLVLNDRGQAFVGLGSGDSRPTFLLDGATSVDIDIQQSNVLIKNMIFKAGHADIVRCINVSANGRVNITIEDCDFIDNTSGENFLVAIDASNTTDNASDGLTVRRCRFISPDTASLSFIEVNADLDGLVVEDCFVSLGVNDNNPALVKCATGKDLTNCRILRNRAVRLNTTGDLLIENDTAANSGIVAYNYMRHADATSPSLVDCDGVGLFENYDTAANDTLATLNPAADS